jgi:hypothetical protein
MRDLGVMLDSKLYFHYHIDFVYSQELRTLGLIRVIIYNFSSLDSLVVLYISLIRSKLELYGIILHRLTPIEQKIYKENLPICVIIIFAG